MSSVSPGKPPEILSLTGLRFVAAFSIVYAHVVIYYYIFPGQQTLQNTFYISHFGMTMFFVLSGFVIHYNYRSIHFESFTSGRLRFFVARFARLYPLYFFAFFMETLAVDSSIFSSDKFFEILPFMATLTQSWFPIQIEGKHMSHIALAGAWSISVEAFLYFLYAVTGRVFCLLTDKKNLGWLIIIYVFLITVASFGTIYIYDNRLGDQWMFYFSPYCRISEFVLGCLIAQLAHLVIHQPPTQRDITLAYGAICFGMLYIVALFLLIWPQSGATPTSIFAIRFGTAWGYAPGVGALIFGVMRVQSRVRRTLESRAAVLLGEASYSLFLLHGMTFSIIPRTPPGDPMVDISRMMVLVCFILMASVGSYRLLEMPARLWLRTHLTAQVFRGLQPSLSGAMLRASAWMFVAIPFVTATGFAGAYVRDTYWPPVAIDEIVATFGGNCAAPRGNLSSYVRRLCRGKEECVVAIDTREIGDPANGCGKEFEVVWQCVRGGPVHRAQLPAGAGDGGGQRVPLSCLGT